MSAIFIRGMQGLGDNIYQRSVLREITAERDVYLETPWPQLYRDLPVQCVPRLTKLRTQAKNVMRTDLAWGKPPPSALPLTNLHYVNRPGSVIAALLEAYGIQRERLTFDLPRFEPLPARRPYIVMRPSTLRHEWMAASRNPRSEYLVLASEKLRRYFHIVSVADLAAVEWADGPLPYADEVFHKGELRVEQLLALIAGAAGVVGGVGWIVPAAIAYGVPLCLIYGGWGAHNGPARILDYRLNLENVYQILPDRFCLCANRAHTCDKTISDIDRRLDEWAIRLATRREAAMVA